jgi:hypothetical protein
MQIGDLVRMKRGRYCKGEILGVVYAVSKRIPVSVRVLHFRGGGNRNDDCGYYRSDLEVICK